MIGRILGTVGTLGAKHGNDSLQGVRLRIWIWLQEQGPSWTASTYKWCAVHHLQASITYRRPGDPCIAFT